MKRGGRARSGSAGGGGARGLGRRVGLWAAAAAGMALFGALAWSLWPAGPWGPRVQVGERNFPVGARPDPRRRLELVLWDLRQPGPQPGVAWADVVERALAPLRARYPLLQVRVRLLGWEQLDGELEQALARQQPPDVLGTPEATFIYDRRWQVPLEGYLASAAGPGVREQLLPLAAQLAGAGARLWGVPRWLEWAGWAISRNGGSRRRLAVDLANPLTWRLLVLSSPSGVGPGPGDGGSIWTAERLREGWAWLQGVQAHLLPSRRVAELGPWELLSRGEAAAAGPLSGRMAFRVGLWAGGRGPARPRPGVAALAAPVAVEGAAAQLPGPLLSASSYVVFAPPGSDAGRVRVAWELALNLAKAASAAMAGVEGVLPAWDPSAAPEGAESGRPEGPAWWERYGLPPGVREALRDAASSGAGWAGGRGARPPGGGAVLQGALEWADWLHEQRVVARWAPELAQGRLSPEEFVARVSR